jgi:hypothetical protein
METKITYEVLLRKGGTSGKRKIEIREFIKDGEVIKERRRKSCEVDENKLKHMKGLEVVHLKETDNILEFVMALRHFDLDSCADKVEEWIKQAG